METNMNEYHPEVYADDMYSYTVYCTNMHTGEEFDFDLQAYSKAHALALVEEDFEGSIFKVDYIMLN
jgi:FAD synthase